MLEMVYGLFLGVVRQTICPLLTLLCSLSLYFIVFHSQPTIFGYKKVLCSMINKYILEIHQIKNIHLYNPPPLPRASTAPCFLIFFIIVYIFYQIKIQSNQKQICKHSERKNRELFLMELFMPCRIRKCFFPLDFPGVQNFNVIHWKVWSEKISQKFGIVFFWW